MLDSGMRFKCDVYHKIVQQNLDYYLTKLGKKYSKKREEQEQVQQPSFNTFKAKLSKHQRKGVKKPLMYYGTKETWRVLKKRIQMRDSK